MIIKYDFKITLKHVEGFFKNVETKVLYYTGLNSYKVLKISATDISFFGI